MIPAVKPLVQSTFYVGYLDNSESFEDFWCAQETDSVHTARQYLESFKQQKPKHNWVIIKSTKSFETVTAD